MLTFGDIYLTGLPAALVVIVLLAVLFYVIIYLPLKILLAFSAHANKRVERMRRLEAETVVHWYEPPEGLTPAELGYLLDNKIGPEEVLGTIFYLQQLGCIELEVTEQSITITLAKKGSAHLRLYEEKFINAVAPYTHKKLTPRILKSIAAHTSNTMRVWMTQQGYIHSLTTQGYHIIGRLIAIVVLIIAVFPLLIFRPSTTDGWFAALTFIVFFLPAYFVIAVFLYKTYHNIVGEPWLATKKLKDIWNDVEGYRNFIEVVEADRLRFENNSSAEHTKNKALPYAIALGIDTGWRSRIS